MSAPASARAIAIAWPIPRVPPVTSAVCPSRENNCITGAMIVVVVSFFDIQKPILEHGRPTAFHDTPHLYWDTLLAMATSLPWHQWLVVLAHC
jgi:hypothetical protein